MSKVLLFSHTITREFDSMSRFCESVGHGVGNGGVFCEDVIPVFYRQLAGDDGRFPGVPVLDEFHEVHQLLAVQDLHSEVLDYY